MPPALQENDPQPAPTVAANEDLDTLFARLQRASNPDDGQQIVREIWAEWSASGSATVDLLMLWADDAITDERFSTALDLLDQVTVLRPQFAEGFNRRATLHYMMGERGKSLADINRVLELEPRHFGALSGMAAIMVDAGRERVALRALERVLEIYPSDRNAQTRLIDLQEELAGDPV